MNDLLLIAVIPIALVAISIVYVLVQIFIETRDTCQHTWTRWSDLQKDGTIPHQTRSCSKCNLYEHRLIK
jgi:hypothetical protein